MTTTNGNIPVIFVSGANLPEAWEKAIVETWERGASVRTEYDRPQDPPRRDATVVRSVHKPGGPPRVPRSFAGGRGGRGAAGAGGPASSGLRRRRRRLESMGTFPWTSFGQ